MKEKTEDHIDSLLKGTISEQDHHQLNILMKEDPAVKELVSESKEAYRFLEFARDQHIKRQLQAFDAGHYPPMVKRNYKPWIFAGIAFLLLTTLSWLAFTIYFQPVNIAKRNFEIHTGYVVDHRTHEDSEFENLNAANKYFLHNDFENAARLFQPIAENTSSDFTHIAKWNVLMCHLAIEGPTARWKNEFKKHNAQFPEPFKSKGDDLLRLLDSQVYKFFTPAPSITFSSIKPRII